MTGIPKECKGCDNKLKKIVDECPNPCPLICGHRHVSEHFTGYVHFDITVSDEKGVPDRCDVHNTDGETTDIECRDCGGNLFFNEKTGKYELDGMWRRSYIDFNIG